MERMLMNIHTGSVAPESEWRQDYADLKSGGGDWVSLWGGEDFEDADLVEVIKDKSGSWVEPKFFCEDCGRPYLDDGSCLSIVNARRDEVKHYCPECTAHGRFELRDGDVLDYDKSRFHAEEYGDPVRIVYLTEA